MPSSASESAPTPSSRRSPSSCSKSPHRTRITRLIPEPWMGIRTRKSVGRPASRTSGLRLNSPDSNSVEWVTSTLSTATLPPLEYTKVSGLSPSDKGTRNPDQSRSCGLNTPEAEAENHWMRPKGPTSLDTVPLKDSVSSAVK